MSDEPTAPADEQEQPTPPEAPAEDQPTPEAEVSSLDDFDLSLVPEDANREWLGARHKALQADYTRKTQELAEQRKQVAAVIEAAQNPDHPQHEEALDYLGLEVAADDDELYDEDDDPFAPYEQRLSAIEQAEQQRANEFAQQQAEAQLEDYLATEIESLQEVEGVDEFSEAELRILVNTAVAMQDDAGNPDVRGAYDALKEAYGTRQKAWLSSKTAPRAPGVGVPASAELDITDRSQRLSEAERIAEAALGE